MELLILFLLSTVKVYATNQSMVTPPTTPPTPAPTYFCGLPNTLLLTESKSYDLWDAAGNQQLKEALNAALVAVLAKQKWRDIETNFGVTPVTKILASWPTKTAARGTFKMILDKKVIRFGSTLTTPPFSQNVSGCITGKEIILADMLAQEIDSHYTGGGIKAKWVEIAKTGDFWTDVSFGLSGGKSLASDGLGIDVILSTTTPSTSRIEGGKAVFTNPYLQQKYGLGIGPTGVAKGITLSNINTKGHSIAVGKGAVNEQYVQTTYPFAIASSFPSYITRIESTRDNFTDAAVGDSVLIKYFFSDPQQCPGCRYLGDVGPVTTLAMAVRPPVRPYNDPNAYLNCTITSVNSASQKQNCRTIRPSSCTACSYSSRDCAWELRDKSTGYCCSSVYCCQKQTCGKYKCSCKKSVKRRYQIKCSNSYTVSFGIEILDTATQRVIKDTFVEDCGMSSSCSSRLKKAHPVNSKQRCVISADQQHLTLQNLQLNSSSKHGISLYFLSFFIWFLLH